MDVVMIIRTILGASILLLVSEYTSASLKLHSGSGPTDGVRL
jgi:hypothetical protein